MKKVGARLFKYPFLLFIFFVLIAYLPVFLPFFHLKNDLVTQNLPTRFVISESLYSGYFPWWNPYIHFGIPQYGDMNNGFWNPFIWVIAKTVGYNIWSITIEEMLYILIGGWGIYKICGELFSREASILTGLAYMACGYTVGHLQHFCWITGTAFFPYVLLFFIRINKNPLVKNFIGGSFSVFFFLASTHPGLIIGSLYFFLFLILFIFLFRKDYATALYRKNFWIINITFLLVSLLLSVVVIASDINVLQHISRGLKLSKEQMLLNPTTFQSYLSLFIPLAVHKSEFFATDISMRNVYIGIGGLTGFAAFIKYQSQKIILATGSVLSFFILLSSGGIFKILFSQFLPFIGYVRMNGEFTYYVILIMLIISAAGLDQVLKRQEGKQFINRFLSILIWIFAGTATFSLLYIILSGQLSVLRRLPELSGDPRKVIKYLVDNLSFSYLLFTGSLLQLTTTISVRKFFFSKTITAAILMLNLIIHTWLILPYTGLGTRSKKEFDRTVTIFEKGIHAPELRSINNTVYLDSSLINDVLMISSYSKKIGFKSPEQYPVQLRSSEAFFEDGPLFKFITNQAYLFLSDDTTIQSKTSFDSLNMTILSFRPGYIKASITDNRYNYITLLQNDYPYWKVKINGNETTHFTGYKTFITVPLPRGNHIVEFIFAPYPIRLSLWISVCSALAGLIILLNKNRRNKKLLPGIPGT